jgi:hypothetical protein
MEEGIKKCKGAVIAQLYGIRWTFVCSANRTNGTAKAPKLFVTTRNGSAGIARR